MSSDIQKKLKKLKVNSSNRNNDNNPAFDILLNQVRKEIDIDIEFRLSVLRRVQTLEHVNENDMQIIAKSLIEVYYNKGDYVIKQDESGDSMYILQEGSAVVLKTTYTADNKTIEKELAKLTNGAFFGEIAISSEEIRTASVLITSDNAKCLKLTKPIYDGVNNKKQSLLEQNKIAVATNIINSISFMKQLPATTKSKLVMSLSISCFNDGIYICRQNSIGHQFYIIVEGQCKVTTNDNENQYEHEVIKLQGGDYFGELALIDPSNKRTANVISVGPVTCLCLSRSDFNALLSSDEGQLSFFRENAIARKNKSNGRGGGILSHFRRISAFDLVNKKSELLAENLFKRLGKFMSEAMWNSMHSRLYRRLTLNTALYEDGGLILKYLFDKNNNRSAFIEVLSSEVKRISDLESMERNPQEVELLFTFLNQENELKSNICKDWPSYMYKELCTKGKILHYRSLKKIVESKKRGGNIYLVLKGAVRIYSVIAQNVNASEYQCDVFPGEIFGDELFKGVLSEYYTALSLTPCEILVLLEKDILGLADEIDVNNMSNDKKMEYLRSVPLFKSWHLQDLYDLGTNLKLETFDKGTQIITKGQISNRLYFIVQGTVNLMRYGATSYRTISCLQKFDYLGESGIINVLKEGKAVEHLAAFCTSKVVVLTLAADNYPCIDLDTIHEIGRLSLSKRQFRRERYAQSKAELKLVKQVVSNSSKQLPAEPLPVITSPIKSSKNNSPIPKRRDLEDVNMLFDGTFDPLMLLATTKDHEREKVLEQIPDTNEKIIRYNGKNAKDNLTEGFATVARKKGQYNTTYLYSPQTDLELDLQLEDIVQRSNTQNIQFPPSLQTSKTLPNIML